MGLTHDQLGARRDEAAAAFTELLAATGVHRAAILAVATEDVRGSVFACRRCDLVLDARPSDRAGDAHGFAILLAVDHYVARHPRG